MNYTVFAFYQFVEIPATELNDLKGRMTSEAQRLGIHGLMILGTEGINCTLCGLAEPLETYREFLRTTLQLEELPVKVSICEKLPFPKFKCKIRDEIVTTRDTTLDAHQGVGTHVSPEEWNRLMQEEDVVVLDTRNWYETKIGKFKGAIDPHLTQFHEFADYLPQSGIKKEQKVLIYCTGGIRCEKAIVEMHRQGFEKVYQLEGGILNYLKKCPENAFEGECFVFDYRVSVDQYLKPTERYRLCPHCGQPGELKIECRQCGDPGVICESCQPQEERQTCSKNCAHHYRMGHRSRLRERRQRSRTHAG